MLFVTYVLRSNSFKIQCCLFTYVLRWIQFQNAMLLVTYILRCISFQNAVLFDACILSCTNQLTMLTSVSRSHRLTLVARHLLKPSPRRGSGTRRTPGVRTRRAGGWGRRPCRMPGRRQASARWVHRSLSLCHTFFLRWWWIGALARVIFSNALHSAKCFYALQTSYRYLWANGVCSVCVCVVFLCGGAGGGWLSFFVFSNQYSDLLMRWKHTLLSILNIY